MISLSANPRVACVKPWDLKHTYMNVEELGLIIYGVIHVC